MKKENVQEMSGVNRRGNLEVKRPKVALAVECCKAASVHVLWETGPDDGRVYSTHAVFVSRISALEYAQRFSKSGGGVRVKVVDIWEFDATQILAVFENGEEVDPLLFWS